MILAGWQLSKVLTLQKCEQIYDVQLIIAALQNVDILALSDAYTIWPSLVVQEHTMSSLCELSTLQCSQEALLFKNLYTISLSSVLYWWSITGWLYSLPAAAPFHTITPGPALSTAALFTSTPFYQILLLLFIHSFMQLPITICVSSYRDTFENSHESIWTSIL